MCSCIGNVCPQDQTRFIAIASRGRAHSSSSYGSLAAIVFSSNIATCEYFVCTYMYMCVLIRQGQKSCRRGLDPTDAAGIAHRHRKACAGILVLLEKRHALPNHDCMEQIDQGVRAQSYVINTYLDMYNIHRPLSELSFPLLLGLRARENLVRSYFSSRVSLFSFPLYTEVVVPQLHCQ